MFSGGLFFQDQNFSLIIKTDDIYTNPISNTKKLIQRGEH